MHDAVENTRFRPVFLLAFALLALTATSAGAAIFTVTLENGTAFETRYRPVEADWDDNVVMIRTDRGNWIALDKSDIVDVASDTETSGFGYQLNTTTIFLGWSPNDLVDDDAAEGDEGDGGPTTGPGGGTEEPAPILYGDEGFNDDGGDFDIFVNPDEGVAGQGFGTFVGGGGDPEGGG